MWEFDPKYEEFLRRNLPIAEVKITDSYKELKTTSRKYSLIVVDNSLSSSDGQVEHFDLFPDIFRVAKNSTILILNVIPEIDNDTLKESSGWRFNEIQLLRHKSFYKTTTPEKISFDEMADTYKQLIIPNGFNLEWYFFQKRASVYYLVLKINKRGTA